jgi:hypothetical protein
MGNMLPQRDLRPLGTLTMRLGGLVASASDNRVRFDQLESSPTRHFVRGGEEIDCPAPVDSLSFSASERLLAAGLRGGRVAVYAQVGERWSLATLATVATGSDAPTVVSFSPGESWLAVACGPQLLKLRVEEHALVRAAQAASGESVTSTPSTPNSEPFGISVDAALHILHSLAMTFHTGQLWPRDRPPAEDREALLVKAVGGAADARHLRFMTEWLFSGPVRQFLESGTDPFGPPTAEQIRAYLALVFGALRRDGGDEDIRRREFRLWKELRRIVAAALAQQQEVAQPDPELVALDHALLDAETESGRASSMLGKPMFDSATFVRSYAPYLNAFHTKFMTGGTTFVKCRTFPAYLREFHLAWSRAAKLLIDEDAREPIEMKLPVARAHLEALHALMPELGIVVDPPGRSDPFQKDELRARDERTWSLRPGGYVRAIDRLESLVEEIVDGKQTEVAAQYADLQKAEIDPRSGMFIHDPWKGIFGTSVANGRRLTARIGDFDSTVTKWRELILRIDSSGPDAPPLPQVARFYLGTSWSDVECATANITDDEHAIEARAQMYKALTVGAITDDGETFLELNLANLRSDAPDPEAAGSKRASKRASRRPTSPPKTRAK